MERERQILEAARDLFLRDGLQGMTMRKIAAAVGISAPAIYKHYADKDEILRRVVDLGRERFASFLVRGLKGETPKERLLLTGESYVEFGLTEPRDYQVMFTVWDKLKPGVHAPGNQGGHASLLQFSLDRVRECLPPGAPASPADVFELGLMFWAECHGLVTLYISGGGSGFMPLDQYREISKRQLRRLVEAVLR